MTDDRGNKVWFDIAKRWNSMPWSKTRTGERRVVTAHYLGQYFDKVEFWRETKAKYAPKGEKACPSYSLRNSWNTRARAAGLPDFAVTRSLPVEWFEGDFHPPPPWSFGNRTDHGAYGKSVSVITILLKVSLSKHLRVGLSLVEYFG